MNPAVRAIIQIPYRGRGGERPGTLLTLQHHRDQGFSYILPGGTLDAKYQGHQRTCLQDELEQELGIHVSRRHMEHVYDYTSPVRTNHIYRIAYVDSGQLRVDGDEVRGIGVFGASDRIPENLLTGNVKTLPKFYADHPDLRSELRRELVIPTGYFNFSALQRDIQAGIIPPGVQDWETQRRNWSAWEMEAQRNRGVPPLNRS